MTDQIEKDATKPKQKKKLVQNKKLYFEPYDVASDRIKGEGKFRLIFSAPLGNDYRRRHTIYLKFELWWVEPIIEEMANVLQLEQDDLDKLKRHFKRF